MRFSEKRQQRRRTTDLQVKLVLYNSNDDTVLCGPHRALVENITYTGAGLILEKIFHPPHHLFYAPKDSDNHVLCLQKSREKSTEIIIPINPVWFRMDDDQAMGLFRMGVQFMTHPEDQEVIDLEEMALSTYNENLPLLDKLINLFPL